jgi:hypothetical protein
MRLISEFAGLFRNTHAAFLDHERSESELKALMPEDGKQAIGHGVRSVGVGLGFRRFAPRSFVVHEHSAALLNAVAGRNRGLTVI